MSLSEASKPVLLPDNVTPEKYVLNLEPDLETFVLTGDLVVHCDCSSATDTISLHSRDIDFRTVDFKTACGKNITATSIQCNLPTHEFPSVTTFTFGEEIPVGKGQLCISYVGELNTNMAGFYRSHYTSINGEKKIMASTQCEALDARRLIPCWDEPAVKAVFECSLTVRNHLTAFANMPETEVTMLAGGKKKLNFAPTPRMSSYLLAFCVGEFDFVQAFTKSRVAVRVYTPPGKKNLGSFALDAAVRSLDFYDDFFGIPYPLPKLDMVAIPEFAMGAMENWGLVTYREVDLLIDTKNASSWQKQRVCSVVTHELAHQWFGNLVTMKWWDNLWLNEGFASWMQNLVADHLYPDWKMWDQFTIKDMAIARSRDALRSSHPIQVPIAHAEEVEEVFDAISYYKGACVVRMIFSVLGVEDFRKGLQNYFKEFAYGNTITTDLWGAWSKVSGKDVASLMGVWTQKMGFPVVNVVSLDEANGNVELRQEWFLSDGGKLSEEEDAKTWTVPLLVKSGNNESKLVLMKDKTMTLEGVAKDGKTLLLNSGQHSLFYVNYGAKLTNRLAASMNQLGAIDRASLLSNALALAKAGKVDLEQLLSLLSCLKGEQEYIVWHVAATSLSYLKSKMQELGDEVFVQFNQFAGRLAAICAADRGWTKKGTDGHLDTLLRADALSMQLAYNQDNAELLQEVRNRVDAYCADPLNSIALEGDLKVPAFKYLLKHGGEAEYLQIMNVFNTVTTNVEKKNVLSSIGSASTNELKLRVLHWSLNEIKVQDFFYPFLSVSSSGPAGRELAFEFFRDNFDSIRSKLDTASASLMQACVSTCCGSFTSHEKANMLEKYLLEEKKDELKLQRRGINQMLETMRSNADFIETCKQSSVADPSSWSKFIEQLD